jgi:hypothetical protein
MEFEDTIKEIINEKYDGDSDKFLKSLEKQTITFLLMGGLCFMFSLIVYNSGVKPYLTGTVGSIIFLIGVFSHRLYNKCYKFLNK